MLQSRAVNKKYSDVFPVHFQQLSGYLLDSLLHPWLCWRTARHVLRIKEEDTNPTGYVRICSMLLFINVTLHVPTRRALFFFSHTRARKTKEQCEYLATTLAESVYFSLSCVPRQKDDPFTAHRGTRRWWNVVILYSGITSALPAPAVVNVSSMFRRESLQQTFPRSFILVSCKTRSNVLCRKEEWKTET